MATAPDRDFQIMFLGECQRSGNVAGGAAAHTTDGRRVIPPFQMLTASAYPASPGSVTEPATAARRVSITPGVMSFIILPSPMTNPPTTVARDALDATVGRGARAGILIPLTPTTISGLGPDPLTRDHTRVTHE